MTASKIDVHHHVIPDFYRKWLVSQDVDADGYPLPVWTPEDSLNAMARVGSQLAIVSVSTPGVGPSTGADAGRIARDLNSYCHDLTADYPGKFAYFATLPLPDIYSSLTETQIAFDELGAAGVILLANNKGVYLGDRLYDPLMAELNLRHAVVLVHPTKLPGPSIPGLPSYAADYLLDTTRAAVNLARNGVLTRYPNIKFILSHGGGFIPYAALRLSQEVSATHNYRDGLRLLRSFYYDTALSTGPYALPSLLRFVPRGHLLFGTDFPFAPERVGVIFSRMLSVYPTTQHSSIKHKTAKKIFGNKIFTPVSD